MMNQRTIKEAVTFKGIGLHGGLDVCVSILPAQEGSGILFYRTDLPESKPIKADASQVYKCNRHTVLGNAETNVATVEHLLSAMYALGIDNAIIEIDGPELPIMDGSALPFYQKIKEVGFVDFEKEKEILEIKEPITLTEGDSEISVIPSDHFEVTVLVDFDSQVLGQQFSTLRSIKDYEQEISSARTFVFLHELEALRSAGLAKGGNLENALVFVETIPSEEQLTMLKQSYNVDLTVQKTGVLEGQELRYANEAARHKLLDLVGDLSLLGTGIKGKIIARKPGHSINTKMAELLKQALMTQRKLKDVPSYDPNQAPLYDINHICTKLHHRFPFLLIDKIIELSDKHVVSVKNVTMNEPYFPGHFPGNPIMPGVLQIEAMAQTGGILVMENIDEPHAYDTFFLKIDGARFRKTVVPGDTLLFRLDLVSPIRRGLVEMKGRAFVGNTLVAEADLLAQIIKRR